MLGVLLEPNGSNRGDVGVNSMKFTMPGSQGGQPSRAFKGRQLSEDAVKFLEKVRSTKGVIDAWASGNDMTFVKLRNFKVVCLRGQNTQALDEQLREINGMNGRSSSLNNLFNLPFRSRTHSELPAERPKIAFNKRRTSDTAAKDLELANAGASRLNKKNTSPTEFSNVVTNHMSTLDENHPLTTADLEQEHRCVDSPARSRASSFGSGCRSISPTMTEYPEFRPRTRSLPPARPAFPRNSSKVRNGTDTSVYFSYADGLFIPPGSDINKIVSKSSSNMVSNAMSVETAGRGEMGKGDGSLRRASVICNVNSAELSDSSMSKSAFNSPRPDSKKQTHPPSNAHQTKKRLSLPNVIGEEVTANDKYSGHKRHSLTGVVGYDSKNITRHTPQQYTRARDIHPITIAQAFKHLTVKKDYKDSEKSEFYGEETVNHDRLPTNDLNKQDHSNFEKTAPRSSGFLSSIWSFFTKKRDPILTSPPSQTKMRPRAQSVDSQMLFHQLCLGRQMREEKMRNSAHVKAIKVSRPGHSRPMYLSMAKTLGGLPETEDNDGHGSSFPTPMSVNSNINQLPMQGRRASCPVIFESEELEEFSDRKKQIRNGYKLPRLWSAGILSKHTGLSTCSEHQVEDAKISAQQYGDSENCVETNDESSDTGVDDIIEDCGATSEIDGVPFITERRSTGSMSSSKSESLGVSERVGAHASFHLTSDDLSSSCELQPGANRENVNEKSSSNAASSKSRRQPSKMRPQKKKKVVSAAKARKVVDDGKVAAVPSRLLSSKSWTESSISISSFTTDGMSSDRISDVSSLTSSAEES